MVTAGLIAARTKFAIQPPCTPSSTHFYRSAHYDWEGGLPEGVLHDLAYDKREIAELPEDEEAYCRPGSKKAVVKKKPLITVVGKLTDGSHQRCKKASEFTSQEDEAFNVQTVSLMPSDYEIIVKELSKAMFGKTMHSEHKANVFVFEGSLSHPQKYIGGPKAYLQLLHHAYGYSDKKTSSVLFQRLAKVHLRTFMQVSRHTFVQMSICIGEESAGQVLIECFDDVCPKTVENFLALVKGDSDAGKYEGSPFHRIVPKGWIQGGDIVGGKGDAGNSIHGETFADETFKVKHDKAGIVGMVNKGPHSNASQFYITLAALPWMDGKSVGIGYVVDGLRALRILEQAKTQNERPVESIVITECSVYTC